MSIVLDELCHRCLWFCLFGMSCTVGQLSLMVRDELYHNACVVDC